MEAEPQGATAPAPDGGATTLDMDQIGAPILLDDSFTLAESPTWDHCSGSMVFSDVSTSTLFRWKDDQLEALRTDTGCANGLAFDSDGQLLLAQMGCGQGGKLGALSRSGEISVVLAEGAMGQALHTPDDVTIRSDGTIYLTDGDFPHASYFPLNPASYVSGLPILARKPDGEVIQVGSAVGPNGIELSPDEHSLYVSATTAGVLQRYSVAQDGSLGAAESFISNLLLPDSLCLDSEGNLYLGVSQGLHIFRPDGSDVGLIQFPSAPAVTSCGFGGPDGKTLYVTAWSSLWKIEGMPIAGQTWSINERMPCAND